MIDTFEGLAVALLALLPGALYTYAAERQAGRYGVALTDRLLRFLAASVFFQALLAPASYQAYRTLIHTHRISDGRPLPFWLWPALVAYIAIPAVLGDQVGRARRAQKGWAKLFTGPSPAPRAWDYLFARAELTGWVRLRLADPALRITNTPGTGATSRKAWQRLWPPFAAVSTASNQAEVISGRWIVGAFSKSDASVLTSYAAGYPEAQDLFLADTAVCDPATGDFLLDPAGEVRLRGVGVLVRWEQVAYLEFIRR